MVWFRVDDGLPQSMKILSIPKMERAAAVGLWTLAGAWAAGQLTDGFVPDYVIDDLPAGTTHRDFLVAAKLWLPITHPVTQQHGMQFHDWPDYQPSRAEVMEERARHAANQKAYRERKRAENDARNVTDHAPITERWCDRGVTAARPDPTRPDPTVVPTELPRRKTARTRAQSAPPESTQTTRTRDAADTLAQIKADRSNGHPPQIGTGT